MIRLHTTKIRPYKPNIRDKNQKIFVIKSKNHKVTLYDEQVKINMLHIYH